MNDRAETRLFGLLGIALVLIGFGWPKLSPGLQEAAKIGAIGCLVAAAWFFLPPRWLKLVPKVWPELLLIIVCIAGIAVSGYGLYGKMGSVRKEMPDALRAQYAYGLVFVGLVPSLDLNNAGNALEIRLELRNASGAPLKYLIENLTEEIAGHRVQFHNVPGLIPIGGQLVHFPGGGFSLADYNAIPARSTGALEYTIAYGHPDWPFVRRATKVMHLDTFKQSIGQPNEIFSLNWIGRQPDTDVPIH